MDTSRLRYCFSNFNWQQNHLQVLHNIGSWISHPEFLIQQVWELGICISTQFPGDADVTGLAVIFGASLTKKPSP